MALDKFILLSKIGDKRTAPGKEHLGQKNTTPIGYIDEAERQKPIEKILSPDAQRIFTCTRIKRPMIPFIKQIIKPVGYGKILDHRGMRTIPDMSKFRLRPRFLPHDVLESVTRIPNLKRDIEDPSKVVPVINGFDLNESHFKSAFDHQIPALLDLNVISAGTGTYGDTGTYPLLSSLFTDVANLTAALRALQVGPFSDNASCIFTENLGGFEFKLTTDTPPNCDPTAGHLISWDVDDQYLNMQQEGPGSTIFEHLHIKTIKALTNEFSHMVISTINTNFDLQIYKCLLDHNGIRGRGIIVADTTLVGVEIFNNLAWGGINSADAQGISVATVGAGCLVENNVVEGYKWCYDFGTIGTTIAKNNVGTGSATADFRNLGNVTGRNNRDGDGSAANGFWGTGTNNGTIVAANEFESLSDLNPKFYDLMWDGTSSLRAAGIAPGSALNITGGKGRKRPSIVSVEIAIGLAQQRIVPVITSITPDKGSVKGGETVTIAGSGFGDASASLTVDGAAVAIDSQTNIKLVITMPAHAAGAVNIVITNADGELVTAVGGYTYKKASGQSRASARIGAGIV